MATHAVSKPGGEFFGICLLSQVDIAGSSILHRFGIAANGFSRAQGP